MIFGRLTHPALVICISMERKYCSFLLFEMPNEGRFFPKRTANPRKIVFEIPNLTFGGGYFISKRLRFMCIGYRCDRLYLCLSQTGAYIANSWSSVLRAVESAHTFYSISFNIDVSTFELS